MLRLLEAYEIQHQTRHLCLAGGVALNCSMNGVIDRSGLFDQMFVQPAASDPGAALGAALLSYYRINAEATPSRMNTVYLGPSFTASEVEAVLHRFDREILWSRPPDFIERVAQLLSEGNVIAWYQGAMEFGPRALGNRSILADPRRQDMKDRVNIAVKKREEFRPFAPSVTFESAEEFFELRDIGQYEHMTIAVKARASRAAEIPAVVHVNGTARVQVVREPANPLYWRLISYFGKITGVPVVLNTSFNVRGEPMVCTPEDAIKCYLGTGIDYLAMDGFLISKKPV